MKHIILEKEWDEGKVCNNPHKGWYIHYYDNCLDKYGSELTEGDYLEDFPGLDHIYLRLSWGYLQPYPHEYRWEILDEVIDKWVSKGYGIAFRITCKETDPLQTFATPKWVMEKGARGTLLELPGGGKSWEPDYGDPVFLSELEKFHEKFALRYADKPWLEYVDIGSYGDWGEGHTAASSRRDWPVSVIKKHIDIYSECYRNTIVVLNDDFVGSRKDAEKVGEELLSYAIEKGLTIRDDSVCVKSYADSFGISTLRNPDFFELFWRNKPVILELEHYHIAVRGGTWKEGIPLKAAVEESHASFVGFHGFPRKWLSENYEVARYLANRSGYWYFLKSVELPELLTRGEINPIVFKWENKGVAPSYTKFDIVICLEREGYKIVYTPGTESDNRKWMPGCITRETYRLYLPSDIPPGEYELKVSIKDQKRNRFIQLGLKEYLLKNDLYTIGKVTVG